jgi:predicted thioesterase
MDEIGSGTHTRAVADRAKFDERLKKKIKQS